MQNIEKILPEAHLADGLSDTSAVLNGGNNNEFYDLQN